MLKWTKKTFAAVRGNESLRIECKAQETKQLGDQKRERKTSWRHCHASFSVLLWGNIRRERKRRAIFTERFSVFAPTRLIVIVVSHRKLLRQYSKPYLCAIIYLSGTFVIRECRILEADQLVYCTSGLSPLFFLPTWFIFQFSPKSFLLHLDLYSFPHWFQIWIASHFNLNKDEFYGQSL